VYLPPGLKDELSLMSLISSLLSATISNDFTLELSLGFASSDTIEL
jgi:hypothetical protein